MSLNVAQSGLPDDEGAPTGVSRRQIYVLLAILVIQLILVSPSLMPSFPQINPFDEAKYVISGRQLLQFEVRDLAWGPLVATIYAPLHLVFGHSPDWFMLETWSGRIVLFMFLWLTTMALGLELRSYLHPYALAGILFVSVPFFQTVANQSDALFAGFAALAVSRLLTYRRTLRISSVVWGSLFVGLAVLCRAEAILLLVLFPILALAIGFRRAPIIRLAASLLLPALAVLFVYLVAFRWSTGSFNLGFQGKAYDSFETNQSVTTRGNVAAGKAEARRLYGTAAENNHSVLRAIARNPKAFALRLWAGAETIPHFYLSFFQNQLGPALMLLGLWGVVRLSMARRLDIIAILAVWSIEPFSSIAFLPRHLIPQLTYIILVLSAVGMTAMIRPKTRALHFIHLGSWGAMALFGWLDGKLALMVAGLIVLLVMGLIDLLHTTSQTFSDQPATPFLLFLCVGLIFRTPFPFPNYAPLGTTSEEQALHFLEGRIPADSSVMAPFPGPAVAARMADIGPGDVPDDARTPDAFLAWMHDKGIAAIYLDSRFRGSEAVYNLISGMAGAQLRVDFTSDDGRIRVLLPPS